MEIDNLINSCSKIHGAGCCHKARFHRYHEQIKKPSGDERKKCKKAVLEAPNPLERRINSTETDGNESVGFHSHQGMEQNFL
jgi:hypothetical protein